MRDDAEVRILSAVRDALRGEERVVLAVSGGLDSMTLLDAATRVRPERCALVVATVDHGTGAAARKAMALVKAEAARRDVPVRSKRFALPGASEAEWRAARWEWLREVAQRERAVIATAHTRDDQVETVVMRLLRGAGARGFAALSAASAIRRPLLGESRAAIESYAKAARLRFVEDPSNADRRYLRNRVRLDLLPAIRRDRPGFDDEILALSREASAVRRALESAAGTFLRSQAYGGRGEVDALVLATLPEPVLSELWPAIASLLGISLDRRGTERLSRFTTRAHSGDRVQLAGGIEVVRGREVFTVRRSEPASPETSVLLASTSTFGRFRFRALPDARIQGETDDPWYAFLPEQEDVRVRAWLPGDRMVLASGVERRVKRFFADAGIPGPLRVGWPVVLVNGTIVWIPGVRRSRLTADMSRRNSTTYYCELYSR